MSLLQVIQCVASTAQAYKAADEGKIGDAAESAKKAFDAGSAAYDAISEYNKPIDPAPVRTVECETGT